MSYPNAPKAIIIRKKKRDKARIIEIIQSAKYKVPKFRTKAAT